MIKIGVSACVRFCIGLLFLCIIENAQAQYETANWIFSEYTLNFVAENPTITKPVLSNYEGAFASYSSDSGELLISTDGSTVWNGKGEIMKNGENITPYRTNSIIIPRPGSDNQYYIFSYNAFNVPGNNNHLLSVIVYAIVDLNANNQQGQVIEKNKVLYNNMHGTFTISGKCDRSVFWLVGDVDTNVTEGSDKIFVFQIDKDGIKGPFTSKPLNMVASSDFKLSPDAKKFLFTASDHSGSGTLISDFSPEKLPEDPIVNVKWIPANGSGEFSSNSRFVYLVAGNKLLQYDVQSEKTVELYNSLDPLGVPQMAANGKIYIPVAGKKKLMVINQPNLAGALCDFNASGIIIPAESFVLPTFASNLFYSGPFPANAGSDKTICSDQSVIIGSSENNATTFEWKPTIYLDDPDKIQPTFQYTGSDPEINSFIYKLTTHFDGCIYNDFVVVKLSPNPMPPVIRGSRSVCPGVLGVQYWTDQQDEFSYSWNVTGGIIEEESNSDSLLVNWGPVNSNAQVRLQAIDRNGCKSEFSTLNVVINGDLKTETPQGLDSVCVNLKDQNRYQVTRTSGSTYEWGIVGGEIISAPGNNKVTVNWSNNTTGRIWVKEKSVTDQAVCLGASDTLNVTVFKDPATINLDFVTVDDLDEKRIHLQASTTYSGRIKEVSVLSRKEGSWPWEEIENVKAAPIIQVSKDNFLTDDYSYQFKVNIINKCDEPYSSNIHRSIRLTADGNEELNLVDLSWSSYNFWTEGEVRYEIVTSLAEPGVFVKTGSVLADTSASIAAEESFQYFIKVKAIRSDGVFTSLSNEVQLDFDRELVIPNVITPNGDGFNDTFEIKNIRLYPENRLIIVNRYGKTILDQPGYDGSWNGGEASPGVYYFTLLIPEKQKEFKGWLQIIK